MSTKIEQGCLAIVVNSAAGNNGTCVQVLEFIGDVKGFKRQNRWRIDTWIKSITRVKGRVISVGSADHCAEHCLLRIDDYQEDKEKDKQDTKIPEEDVCSI